MTWENIKIEILTLSARHCCVCHRYAGLKIEVHHIQPKAKGGADTLENAIALCFDCHTDAGHYNSEHPRGTKFSPKELLKAKENWFEMVKDNKISIPAKSSQHLHCRHLVLKNAKIAEDVLNGKWAKLPIENTILLKNQVSVQAQEFLNGLGHHYAYVIEYRTFQDLESVKRTYPNSLKPDKAYPDSPYYHFERIPLVEELWSLQHKLTSVNLCCLKQGIPTEYYVRSVIYESHGCGEDEDGSYIEILEFRDIWFSFLEVTNLSREAVQLSELKAKTKENILSFYSDENEEEEFILSFPKTPIKPEESVLIPTYILAIPFGYEHRQEIVIKRKSNTLDEWHYFALSKSIGDQSKIDSYMIFGTYLRPKELTYSIYNQAYTCDIHELNPANLYTLDEYWDCGSCPHLFVLKSDNRWYYVKELFARNEEKDQLESYIIEDGISKIRIAELENETTFLHSISINGDWVIGGIEMNQGDVCEMVVKPGDHIQFCGHYRKNFENIPKAEQPIFRNRVIGEYLAGVNGMLDSLYFV